jgi:hypothetical protein
LTCRQPWVERLNALVHIRVAEDADVYNGLLVVLVFREERPKAVDGRTSLGDNASEDIDINLLLSIDKVKCSSNPAL